MGIEKMTNSVKTRLAFVAIVVAIAGHVHAQDTKKKKELKPGPLTLETSDGVILECTWYPSEKGKEAVPIVLLHDWEGKKGDYAGLAAVLQKLGHAVIVPDLRGHGQSTRVRTGNPNGPMKIELKKMKKAHIASIRNDVRACKKFLVEQNNKGKLNIEKLCIVGAGMSTLTALDFAAYDWNRKQLPNFKMGRDVRGLVLISPKNSFKGLTNRYALAHPYVRAKVSTMIIVGDEQSTARSEAKRLFTRLQRYHDPIPETREERLKNQDLFLVNIESNLQSTRLLAGKGLPQNPAQYISTFVKYRLQDKTYTWAERKDPLRD